MSGYVYVCAHVLVHAGMPALMYACVYDCMPRMIIMQSYVYYVPAWLPHNIVD